MLPIGFKKDLKLGLIGFFVSLGGGLIDGVGFFVNQRWISFGGVFIAAGGILTGFFVIFKIFINILTKAPSYQYQEPSYAEITNTMNFTTKFVFKTILILCSIIVIFYFMFNYFINK